MTRSAYHHGSLREALVASAQARIEKDGPDALSMRDLAQSLGVSPAAPYRHFPDRKALLEEVASRGFADLDAAYRAARAGANDPVAAMRGVARAYLALAFGRPGLFQLMFGSDILGATGPPALLEAAGQAWESLFATVQALEPGADIATAKRRAITGWSTLHGFIALVQGGRLKGFMTEPLTESDLLEAIIDKTLRGD